MTGDVKLRLGESCLLRKGFFLFMKRRLIYAGMSGPETYSLVVRVRDGYQAYAYNLFVHKDTTELEIEGQRIRVKCLSKSEFWFELLEDQPDPFGKEA